jgi:hypothetical protein
MDIQNFLDFSYAKLVSWNLQHGEQVLCLSNVL